MRTYRELYEELLASDARVIVTQQRDITVMVDLIRDAYTLMLDMDEQRMELGLGVTEGVEGWRERAASVLDLRCWTCGCVRGDECIHSMCFDPVHVNRKVEA